MATRLLHGHNLERSAAQIAGESVDLLLHRTAVHFEAQLFPDLYVTVDELFQGKRLGLPMARMDAVKAAAAAGDADKQDSLF